MAAETVANTTRGHVPYVDASACNGLLFEVLTLIHAAADLSENGASMADKVGVTDEKSRITYLLAMARDKTASAIETLKI